MCDVNEISQFSPFHEKYEIVSVFSILQSWQWFDELLAIYINKFRGTIEMVVWVLQIFQCWRNHKKLQITTRCFCWAENIHFASAFTHPFFNLNVFEYYVGNNIYIYLYNKSDQIHTHTHDVCNKVNVVEHSSMLIFNEMNMIKTE